ncbi:hypothetical protein SAMN05216352_108167 [Alteribacillus bidgolensis]|uniref:Uncharacterized protein n=1 Tax=Alteribacillus bidgolensis TaxID=930129 RepID=A0A1G8L5I0_9BACI|nr:hypothetical protein SAMN05216352_108167 [Alteribacillus bidgolensis]
MVVELVAIIGLAFGLIFSSVAMAIALLKQASTKDR